MKNITCFIILIIFTVGFASAVLWPLQPSYYSFIDWKAAQTASFFKQLHICSPWPFPLPSSGENECSQKNSSFYINPVLISVQPPVCRHLNSTLTTDLLLYHTYRRNSFCLYLDTVLFIHFCCMYQGWERKEPEFNLVHSTVQPLLPIPTNHR